MICATFTALPQHAGACRILSFPGGDHEPEFKWALVKYDSKEQQGSHHTVLHINAPEWNQIGTGENKLQGRMVIRESGAKLSWSQTAKPGQDPNAPNIGVRKFTRGQACTEDLKSPLYVVKTIEHGGNMTYGNMDMRDARTAADMFSHINRLGRNQTHLQDLRVLGAVIACDGRVGQGKPKWDQVVLNGVDKIWSMTGSSIANLLGLPLLVRSINNPWDVPPDTGYSNREITLLYREFQSKSILPRVPDRELPVRLSTKDPKVVAEQAALDDRRFLAGINGFGSTMQMFDLGKNGTCYAVRADGRPFLKEHAEALCSFISKEVEPQLVSAIAGLSTNDAVPGRDEILNSITKEKFLEHYEAVKEGKVASGHAEWADLPDPYKVKQGDMKARIDATLEAQIAQGFEQQSDKYRRQELVIQGISSFTMADMQESLMGYTKGY